MDKPVLLKMLVSILDRGKGARAVELYQQKHLHFHFASLGHGTANSLILDYLGLGETEKDIVLTIIPAPMVHTVLSEAEERFQLQQPGKGIVFSMPLSGVSGAISQVIKQEPIVLPEGEEVEMEHHNDLILAVVNQGSSDIVMDAARSVGARGGTVMHARRLGHEHVEQVSGIHIEPEKEIIAILANRSEKHEIMQAISKAAGITTDSRGMLFSLPVDEIVGLSLLNVPKDPNETEE